MTMIYFIKLTTKMIFAEFLDKNTLDSGTLLKYSIKNYWVFQIVFLNRGRKGNWKFF